MANRRIQAINKLGGKCRICGEMDLSKVLICQTEQDVFGKEIRSRKRTSGSKLYLDIIRGTAKINTEALCRKCLQDEMKRRGWYLNPVKRLLREQEEKK